MVANSRVPRGQGRDELIAATLRLVARRGIHALTMRDIAAESGLSLGSTTYHFPDRSALLHAALALYVADTERLVTAAVNTSRKRRAVAAAGGVHDAMRALFADRHQVVIRAELRVEATRDDALHELHLRCREAVQSLVSVALRSGHQPAGARATRVAVAVLDTVTIDTAGDRDDADFAAEVYGYLADAFDVRVVS